MSCLVNFLQGCDQWVHKLRQIERLHLPIGDFYTHLVKEAKELKDNPSPEELVDVINCVGMIYVCDKKIVTLQDCYNKLLQRERKYEQERQHP